VDANSHRRSFGYDAADQQVRAWDALGQQTEWVYDAGGRLQMLKDPRGADYSVSYDYDGLDRPTGMQAAALDQAITMAYNEAGWRTSLGDGTGTTRFAHDALGRITAVTAPNTGTVGYSYTPGGERATLSYPDQTRLSYRYWPDGQLWRVEQGLTLLAEYGYNAAGLLATVARANGATTSYDYDGVGRLRQLETGVEGQAISQFSYELDRAGLRRVVTERLRLPDTLPSTPTPPSATPTTSPTTTPPSATPTSSPTASPTASPTTTPPSVTPTASPTASPTPIPAAVLDSFDRADGPVGSNWTGATSAFQIRDNQLAIAGGDNTLFWSQAFGAEQEASVTLSAIDSNSTEIDLLLKAQDSSGCNLLEVWYQPATNVVQVWTCDPANGWRQQGSDIGVSFAPGDRFGARADAEGVVTVFKNGEAVGAVTVGSDWPHRARGGRIGLWNIGGSNRFDDFDGGSVAGSEPEPTPSTPPNATACAPLSPLPCSAVAVTVPLRVDWNGSEGGLDDATGVGTGFTMTLPPSSPLAAPSNPSAPGYEPALLSVDTQAQQLVITSSAGKLYTTNNSQVNALGVGVAISEPLQLSLTLVAPDLVGSSGDAYQQAGLWFGTDEENYVKLVVMKESGANGVVQLLPEVAGAAPVEYNTASLTEISSQTITLTLELDPERKTVAGWYQFAGGEREPVSVDQEPTALPASFFNGVDHDGDEGTAPLSYLGVLTTHGNSAASAISFRVDDFSVAPLAGEEGASVEFSSQGASLFQGRSLAEQRPGKPLSDSAAVGLAAQAAGEPVYLPLLRRAEREQAAERQSSALLLATALTSRTLSYDYDGLSRLTSAVERGASTTSYAYTYDLAGNRTGETVNGVTRTWEYNAANQVEGWEYDAAGNLLSDGTTRSTYDALNRLSSRNGVSYSYNGDGTLVSRSDGTATTLYAQDLVAPLSQVLNDGSANYLVYSPGERLAISPSGSRTWYIADALGSVRQTLDDAGTPLATASYDPWGTPQSSLISPFGFTGELQDAAGLTYLRARWYNPSHGTLTSVDPFSGFSTKPYSLHPYQYSYSNPVSYVDPSGLSPQNPNAAEGTYIHALIQMDFLAQFPPQFAPFNVPIGGEIEKPFPRGGGFADMADNNLSLYYEIKHNSNAGISEGLSDLQRYNNGFNRPGLPLAQRWKPGRAYFIEANYGLWPYGLDPAYQPQKSGNVYFVIKAKYHSDGLIVYYAEPLRRGEKLESFSYNPRLVENFIRTQYPFPRGRDYPGGAQPMPQPGAAAPFSEPNCKYWMEDGSCAEYYTGLDALFCLNVVNPPVVPSLPVTRPVFPPIPVFP
jgi:RHS repeat-associated protein